MPTPIKERPILFSSPMIRAIMENRKTQTRRIIKPQPEDWTTSPCVGTSALWPAIEKAGRVAHLPCPYGVPGDRLWVRETFFSWRCKTYTSEGMFEGPEQAVYRADGGTLLNGAKWRPSIFMPRWASRITLEITDVRIQRLQDTSNFDAKAEGIEYAAPHRGATCGRCDTGIDQCYVCPFRDLWNSINAKTHPWDSNPFCWVLTFRRINA